MIEPTHLPTKIFLDSGNQAETKKIIELLGFLDGQTTNPSLVVKNPDTQSFVATGKKFSRSSLMDLYKHIVREISAEIPKGSVSIEVYADKNSTKEDLLTQAEEMNKWIPNAHIKFPTTFAGLAAAEEFVNNGGKVNLTLVFSQKQALAVHLATKNMKQAGDVFVSPFIGRLDDIGINGLDLIKNILQMYSEINSEVQVLAASSRTIQHFEKVLEMKTHIITAPFNLILDWKNQVKNESDNKISLKTLEYENLQADVNWQNIDISHELTDKGLDKFAKDWNDLIE